MPYARAESGHVRHVRDQVLGEEAIAPLARISTRDIRAHIGELYDVVISRGLVAAGTDSLIDEVHARQGRPLEATHAVMCLEAEGVKICYAGTGPTVSRSVCAALATTRYSDCGQNKARGSGSGCG